MFASETTMSQSKQLGAARHAILWSLVVVLAIVLVGAAYIVFGPGPTDFAGGKRVSLTAYHQQDPTGVPAELTSASPIVRGE
jgi:hypothetical protein